MGWINICLEFAFLWCWDKNYSFQQPFREASSSFSSVKLSSLQRIGLSCSVLRLLKISALERWSAFWLQIPFNTWNWEKFENVDYDYLNFCSDNWQNKTQRKTRKEHFLFSLFVVDSFFHNWLQSTKIDMNM